MGRQNARTDQANAGLWLLMSSLTARCGREALRGLDGCKLGMQGARVLTHLVERDGQSCSSLAAAVGLEPTALSHLLRALTDQGLITRARSQGDRRTIEVTLTPHGRQMADQCRAMNARMESLLVAGIPRAEVQHLHAVLARMSANLDTGLAAEA